MILRLLGVVAVFTACAGPLAAKAPTASILPVARPGSTPEAAPETDYTMRPVLRPADLAPDAASPGEIPPAAEEDRPPVTEVAVNRLAVSPLPVPRPRVVYRKVAPDPGPERVVAASAGVVKHVAPPQVAPPRPEKRPPGLLRAIFNAPNKPSQYPREGSVCGDSAIRGQKVPPVPARIRGCGIKDPVRITAVDGVVLSTPATVNCNTALSLRKWVTGVAKPAVGRYGGGIAGLKVAASYSCRTRNNVPGAKISEHGRGNAIDISAIILKNGSAMTVLRGWRDRVQGPILKAMHAKACGTFGTVLGPNSDRYHQDHFHFDVARHRNGFYCR